MDIEKLNINAVCLGILCNFPHFCGEERAKEAAELVRALQAENEKLRAELDEKEKYYDQMIDALSATDSAELEQVKRERDAAVALAHEWEEYGRYLSPMGFTVPHNWRDD